MMPKARLMWCVLIALRCLWTLVPQTGYIHPDEFFQSVEVVAGNLQMIVSQCLTNTLS